MSASMVLDTGTGYYSAVMMPRLIANSAASRHVGQTARPPNRPKGTGGEISIVAARPRWIGLGSARQDQPVIGLVQSESAGVPWDGTLGAGFFQGFVVAFDYSTNRLFLKPNGRAAAAQPFDASGVGFRRDDGEYVVDVVVPDTAAALAGVREGDLLVSIDGKDARSLTLLEIRRALSRTGADCTIVCRRDGVERRLVLRLAPRL